ncbi:2-succinyl-6-hydroxy-2,4-cyclohexadiene-1-carboxylate synthase [Stenomitos frigidus]|uniref:Putative 2-succinyl-6-hydroxy-2,4-cyclohexadiene-1-carboxylate synthase n=1 Tax=Stenomitos frigidus ULC18 TaxID=2107698 RepID=A0A2T1E9D3_9CYAN|nr:2-succinyl-6-hydroxy-2,4-cyclohexadiene-1-carboxylate synthase [Stenomitos frigidus]PSB29328.1 2-succinyl-6-hydroxy-2,4-cyclohexadiene-1-carboxylate synthase [Stenomitos frigidus ULC18]
MGYQFHSVFQGDRALPVVLFLHGFLGSSADFDAAIAHLSEQFCCLAVDLPGHGETVVDGEEELYTMPKTANAIVAWLDELQVSRCFLVGYSMGGRLALYLALHFPQRFPKVVLESASPGLPTATERAARLRHDHALADRLEADFPAFLVHWYSQPLFYSLRHQPTFLQVQERRSRNRPSELAKSLRRLSTGLQPSLWDLLPQTPPTLLLVGEDDRKFCAINQAMADGCATIQLEMISGCGHVIHLEKTAAFIKAVQAFFSDSGKRTDYPGSMRHTTNA